MQNMKSYMIRIFEDSFGLLSMVTITRILSSSSESPKFPMTPVEVLERFKAICADEDAKTLSVFHILLTSFFLVSLFSILLSTLFTSLYITQPFFMKIATNVVLPFASYFYFGSSEFAHYKWPISCLISLYSIHKIYDTIKNHNSLPYKLAGEFTDKFWHMSPKFFSILVFQLGIVFIDCTILRFLDLKPTSVFQIALFSIYMIYLLNVPSFSSRSAFTVHFMNIFIPGFIPFRCLDFVAMFFNLRAFAATKVLFYISSKFDSIIYRPLKGIWDPEVVTPFEEDRSHSYFCAIYNRSFIAEYKKLKGHAWKGEFRKKMKIVNFKDDFFPAILISLFIILYGIQMFKDPFFRSQEAAMIVFSYFFIVIEIFNSYIFIEIFKSYYGMPLNLIQSSVQVPENANEILSTNLQIDQTDEP